MKTLDEQISLLKRFTEKQHVLKPGISAANAGWHIEHSLLAIEQVMNAMLTSEGRTFVKKRSLRKFMIMFTGHIPRGKVRSPKSILPAANYTQAGLLQHVEDIELLVAQLKSLPVSSHFPHPFFGSMRAKEAKRFMEVHTNHHLKIIEEILKD